MPGEPLIGGCLCTAIRYRIDGELMGGSLCHCASCRRASGAPAVAWTVLRRTDFHLLRGEPASIRSSPPVVRTFCGNCGTPLTYRHDDSPLTLDVTTATLDDAKRHSPTREIWISHRLPWMPLNASLPHYPEDHDG